MITRFPKPPARVTLLLRWAAGLVIVAVVVLLFDVRSLPANLRRVDWLLALPAITGLTLAHVLAAFTWRLLARRLASVDLRPWFAVRAYFAAQLIGGITPGNIGSDVYRAAAMSTGHRSWGRIVTAIGAQRISSYASLMSMCVVAAFFVPVEWPFRLLAAVVAGGFILLGASIVLNAGIRGRLSRLLGASAPDLGVGDPQSSVLAFVSAFALGVAFHAIGVVLTCILVLSVAPVSEPVAALAAITVTRGAALIPLTPSGLGVQEATLVLLLPGAGTTAGVAIVVSTLVRLATLLTMGVGLVALVGPGSQVRTDPTARPVVQGGAR